MTTEQKEKVKKGIHYAWWILVAVVIFFGITRGGVQKALGQLYPAAALTYGVDASVTSLAYTISGIVGIFWAPIAGRLLAKYNLRYLLSIGAVAYCGAFAAFYLAANVPLFYVIFVVVGMGSAIMTIQAGPVLINRWFKEKKGLATGIMMAAVGLIGGLIQGFLGQLIATYGWQSGSAIIGIASLVICLPVIFLMVRNAPSDKKLLMYGDKGDAPSATESGQKQASAGAGFTPGVPVNVAIKKPAFYCMLLCGFFITAVAAFSSLIPTMARFLNFADVDVAVIGGNGTMFFMFGTVVGALCFGSLTDRIGARNSGIIAVVVGIIATAVLIFGARVDLNIFYGGLFLYGIMATCSGTMTPLLTIGVFGPREFPKIYGFVQSAVAIGGMVTIPVFTFILTQTKDIMMVLYAVAGIMVLIIISIVLAFASSKGLQEYMVPPATPAGTDKE
ncbi:MAG: MFS transporter [Coriobacteriaceae bacterium]|jgi:MFS family permease|nr:MFS transporter [Coriobacteriaceae bacterium]